MPTAKCTFRILNSSEEPYSEDEGNKKLTSGIHTLEYSGDLAGRSILMELKNYTSPKTASVYGLERFTGSYGEKTGSFVIEHIGIFNNGVLVSNRRILADSSSGDFVGLKGKAEFDSEEESKFAIAFELSFD